MATNLNKVILVGTCTGEPELDGENQNRKEAHLSLGVTEIVAGKEVSEFHYVVLKNEQADYALNNIHNGSQVLVEGRIHSYSYQDHTYPDTQRRNIEIWADRVYCLDNNQGNANVNNNQGLQRPNGSWSNQLAQGDSSNFNNGNMAQGNAQNSGFGSNNFNSFNNNANNQSGFGGNTQGNFNQGFNNASGFGNAQGGFNQGFNNNQGFGQGNQSNQNNGSNSNNGGFGGQGSNEVPF